MHVLLSFEGRGVMHLLGFYSQSLKRGTRSLCLWALQDQRGVFGFSTDTVWGLYVPACRMPAPFTHLNVSDLENFLWSFDLFWFSFEAAIYAHFPGPKCSCSNIYFADLPAEDSGSKCFNFKTGLAGIPLPLGKGLSRRVPTLASRKKKFQIQPLLCSRIQYHALDYPNLKICKNSRYLVGLRLQTEK